MPVQAMALECISLDQRKRSSFIAVLHDWEDASISLSEVFEQLKALSTFTTESFSEHFGMIKSIFLGGKSLRAKENLTLWNPIGNASVTTVNKRGIGEVVAQCRFTTRLHQDSFYENGALEKAAKS